MIDVMMTKSDTDTLSTVLQSRTCLCASTTTGNIVSSSLYLPDSHRSQRASKGLRKSTVGSSYVSPLLATFSVLDTTLKIVRVAVTLFGETIRGNLARYPQSTHQHWKEVFTLRHKEPLRKTQYFVAYSSQSFVLGLITTGISDHRSSLTTTIYDLLPTTEPTHWDNNAGKVFDKKCRWDTA
jgi:hypothetical protein